MHIILENHAKELSVDYEYEDSDIEKKFERFCNYCIVSKHYFGRFTPSSVTTNEDDASIDGLAVIVNGDVVLTADDAEEIFKTHKTNLPVDLVLTQVKSGERFQKEEIANFKIGLEDFLSLEPRLPNGSLNKEVLDIFKVVLKNLKKVRNRRPNCHVYYCTSGVYTPTREIKASFDIIERYLTGTELFNSTSVTPMGRSELIRLHSLISEKNEAKLQLIDFFGMPVMPGIPQSYVGIVNAKNLVEALLEDPDGNLRESVFEENVRSFLGDKNDVNAAIQKTLGSDKKSIFSVLNNGITVVSPEMTLTPNTKELELTSYQIINGCQTSSTLHANKHLLDNTVNIVAKFIQSSEDETASDIISATNSQSDIPKESFFGLKTKAKLVQRYFKAENSHCLPEHCIYFERRQGEYKHSGYQSTRIFDVREVARCYAAMFLNLPHNAARYVATIFSNNGDNVFKEDDHESYYYAACLALYKYQALINGRKIGAQNYIKVRWHLIQLFNWLAVGSTEVPPANSRKAASHARKVINILNSDNKAYIRVFERCQDIVDAVGFPSDDELKRGKFTSEILQAARTALAKVPTEKGPVKVPVKKVAVKKAVVKAAKAVVKKATKKTVKKAESTQMRGRRKL